MRCHMLEFDGSLLARGFWLYVWRITCPDSVRFYVGRTGDSSSAFASSPFVRLGRHLDNKPYVTANTLHRQLSKAGIEPAECKFEFFCYGPLFQEQQSLEAHRQHRDIVSRLEGALAIHFHKIGPVLGKHPNAQGHDASLFSEIVQALESKMLAHPKQPNP